MGTISTAQIELTEAELKLLQTLVYQECGMFFDERRSHFLKDRLQRRLKACTLDSFYSYYRLLTSREGRAELAEVRGRRAAGHPASADAFAPAVPTDPGGRRHGERR